MAICLASIWHPQYLVKCQNQQKVDSILTILHSDKELNDTTTLRLLSEIAFFSTDPNDNIHFGMEVIKRAKLLNDKNWMAAGHMHVGDGFRLKGELSKAIENYLHSANFYEKSNNIIGISTAYSNLGSLYSSQGNFENSKHYSLKAIDIFRKEGDSIRLASSLLNLGDEYFNQNKLDTAILYFQKSDILYSKTGYKTGSAYALGNIGLVYAQQGKNQPAEKNIKDAILILTELGDYYPISVYQTYMADIYAEKGDLNRALVYAHSALTIGQKEGLKEQIRDASLKLSELYQAQGDYRKAYDYQSQYITYRDSINNEETIRKMADLRTEYEVSKKQAEVDLKQTEVDLLNEQARSNQIVLWSVIVILVLVLCLTFALFKVYRTKVRAIRIVKKRRQIITAQRDQLEEANQTKDKFFSIISHDIRGPISNFQGVAQLIHLMVESNDQDGLLKLGTMLDTSSKEVSALLDNLLEWAMSQQGRIPYKPEEIKLHQLCNSNLSIMENLAAAKQIRLTKKIKEKVTIQADKNSVSTIIRNLVSNAIKFTPVGGKVKLTLGYEVNTALITVQDSGIGIPKDKMSRLFDFKGERSRWGTEGEKGVGLGLTLVHEFVELNKGSIEVESEEGKGTTFKVFLPILGSSL